MRVYFESNKVTDKFGMAKMLLVGAGLVIAMSLTACGQGPAGKDGAVGATGATGSQGEQGVAGTNGTNGKDGSSCSVTPVPANSAAPNGGALVSCTNGTSSLILNGENGKDGQDGKNGSNGVNGTNGTNGTVITPIQFCGNSHGSYPSTFPEVGFCINDAIYAVYSANGGFLTEVLPGTWSSDGINSSCTFTVKPHCVVND